MFSETKKNKNKRSSVSLVSDVGQITLYEKRKMRILIFLISETQNNFRNELFDSGEAQRNSAIAELHFRTN